MNEKTKQAINELREQLSTYVSEINKKIKILEYSEDSETFKNPMEPIEGEGYYYIDIDGKVGHLDCFEDYTCDFYKKEAYNIFTDYELAQTVANIQKLYRGMYKDSLDSWKDEIIDWKNLSQHKWTIDWINYDSKTIDIMYHMRYKNIHQPIFKTKWELINSIKKHRESFDEVYGTKGYEIE